MSLYGFCYCLFISCTLQPVSAQDFPYTFQTWNANNGLSSNYCNAIVQNSNGYLYVGTNNGLYVFNGSTFKKATQQPASKLVSEGNVEDILIDAYNRIWFASIEFGVGLIDLKERNISIQYFIPPPADSFPNPQILNNPGVSKLCFDSKGNLWAGTRGNGLYKLDTLTKKFTYVPVENSTTLYNKHIRSLFLYRPDTLFVGLVNGLSIINPLNDQVSHLKMHFSGESELLRPTVRRVLPWAADSFMLATDRGTFWLTLHNQLLSSIYSNLLKKIDFRKVNSNDIFRFSKDEIWVATEDDGILFYNMRTHKFNYSFKQSEFNPNISKGFINKLYKAADGNIWIAHQNGLSLFQIHNTWLNNFADSDNRLFAGTLITDGQHLLCFKSNSITTVNTTTGEVEVKKIAIKVKRLVSHCHAIDYSPHQYMLFVNDAVYLLHKKTYHLKPLPLHKDKVDPVVFKHFRVIKSIVDTVNGQQKLLLLAKTINGNILLNYFPATGDLVPFVPPGFNTGDFRNGFTNIAKAGNGKYWISTLYNGMIYVDGPGSAIQYASTPKNTGSKIPEGEIIDFTLTTDSDLWLLIRGKGLVHISIRNKKVRHCEVFAEQEGLTDNSLYNIVHDFRNNLWITSNTGVFCFLTQKKGFLKYTAANGFGNMNFHIYEANMAALPNGYIGIYEQIGNITWFKPQARAGENKIKLLLPFLQVNEQAVNLNTVCNPLPLSPYENNISFQYDIIDFDKTSFYEVIYKLDNFDDQWHPAYQNKELRYTQLPPGNYTFRVKLKYANNLFSPEKTVQFTIATIWYKTWWFKVMVVCMSLGILCFIIRGYIRQKLYQQKKQLELQQAVAVERARISTELHDDLGGGLSTIRILSESPNHLNGHQEPNENLVKISTHSKELLQKMTEIVWALNIKNDSLDQMLSYIRLQTVQALDAGDIPFKIAMPETMPALMVNGVNRRHLLLLVKEAVNNIIKHAGADFVDIHFNLTGAQLQIQIHDNGKGIDDINTVIGMGNGLYTMQQHAKSVGGVLSIEKNGGTCVNFSVPLSKISYESVISNAQYEA
jgi:signal transduction histidine kinase/ligand-binding sensor domain-containing protein